MSPNPAPPDLDTFLHSLRVAGLPIGAQEILRLHHVFELAPTFEHEHEPSEQLRDLLRAALVHDPDEARLFDRVYALWSPRWQQWLRRGDKNEDLRRVDDDALRPLLSEERLAERSTASRRHPRRSRWRRWRVVVRLALLLLLTVALERPAIYVAPPEIPEDPPPPSSGQGGQGEPPPSSAQPDPTDPTKEPPSGTSNEARPTETIYIPHFEVLGQLEGFGVEGWRLAYGGSLLLAALGLGIAAAKKTRSIEVRPPPTREGPARLPLLPLVPTGPELLDEQAIRTLVWGVERHVTEHASREIDAPATADASAERAGLPTLRFVPEEKLREVWLWLDTSASADTLIELWGAEIAEQLGRAGLPVRVGHFDGIPNELEWDEGGQLFDPQGVEAHRQTALVAVLTDGEVLRGHHEDERWKATLALLHSLGHWPRLALVDCSTSQNLEAVLPDLPVPCITPTALPAFFGLGRREAEPSVELDPGTRRAWRAALALGGRPADRATAWAIGRKLELNAPAWAVRQLGDLRWSAHEQHELVAWLARDGQPVRGSGIRPGSLLEGALDFWQARFEAEAQERSERETLDTWDDSRAERHLEMELALLALWREPEEAAPRLHTLSGGELEETLRSRLGQLAPRDGAGDTLTPLPWRLAEVDDVTRQRLAAIGLGGVTEGALRRPGRWVLGLVLLVSVGLMVGGRGLWVAQTDREPRVEVVNPIEGSQVFTELAEDDGWRVIAAAPGGQRWLLEDVGGQRLRVDWLSVGTLDMDSVTFVRLSGGTFQMGSEQNDPLADTDEHPAHQVTVGDFWMAQTEITNAQYQSKVPDHPESDDLPATGINWSEARTYCQSLTDTGDGWQVDLPTEAEWEYAARAGTQTAWSFGDDERLIGHYAWFDDNSDTAQEVSTRAPNPWGLYDMHGNVWEWVLDCYGSYPDGPLTEDPALVAGSCHQDDTRSEDRVLRGGAFWDGPRDLRSAIRSWGGPEGRDGDVGFRCVRRPVPQP